MLPAPGRPGWLRCAGPYQAGLGWSGHRSRRSRLHGLRFCWRELTIGGHTYVPLDVDVLMPCRDTLGSPRIRRKGVRPSSGFIVSILSLVEATESAAHERVRGRRRLGGGGRGLSPNADRRRLRSSAYGGGVGFRSSSRYAFHKAGVTCQRDYPAEGDATKVL
jgi:hypothetical protein